MALGTDLALPSALLAGVIAYEGDSGQHEGALLWLVELCHQAQPGPGRRAGAATAGPAGLHPGTRSEADLQTLSLAYAVLPCLLKLAAAAALYLLVVRRTPGSAAFQARDFLNATLHLTHHQGLPMIQRRTFWAPPPWRRLRP